MLIILIWFHVDHLKQKQRSNFFFSGLAMWPGLAIFFKSTSKPFKLIKFFLRFFRRLLNKILRQTISPIWRQNQWPNILGKGFRSALGVTTWTKFDEFSENFRKRGVGWGGGQKPFGSFLKIHRIWSR